MVRQLLRAILAVLTVTAYAYTWAEEGLSTLEKNSSASTKETLLINCSTNGPVAAERCSARHEVMGRKAVNVEVLLDRATGYFWWAFRPSNFDFSNHVSQAWSKSFWVVPDLGMMRIVPGARGLRFEISRRRATDLDSAMQAVFGQLDRQPVDQLGNEVEPQVFVVALDKVLGMDFFSFPNDARQPPAAKVLSLKHSKDNLAVTLQSGVTGQKATVTLDKNFKVIP